jgi:hypothetical protein
MRLTAFATLRDRHPDLRALIDALETEVVRIVSGDRNAIIDDRVLSDRLRLRTDREEDDLALLLADLVAQDALATRVFWKCARGLGTSAEARSIPDLPASLECDRCGEEHTFSADYLDMQFLPTHSLVGDIESNPGGPAL